MQQINYHYENDFSLENESHYSNWIKDVIFSEGERNGLQCGWIETIKYVLPRGFFSFPVDKLALSDEDVSLRSGVGMGARGYNSGVKRSAK